MGLTVRGGVFLETNCRAVAPVGQVDCVNFACKLENIDLSFGCLTQGGMNRKLGFVWKFRDIIRGRSTIIVRRRTFI